MLFKIRKNRAIISFFIIITITLINLHFQEINIAYAVEPFVKIVGGSTGSQETEVMKDEIIQTGTHNSADDDTIRYRTLYYRMTTKKYDLDYKFKEGTNDDIPYAFVPMEQRLVYDNGTKKVVNYTIKQEDFMGAAADPKLGITGDYIVKHGKATVYLNNVFDIFQGENTLQREVYGYQDMLSKEGWSSASVKYLKGYYNFEYTITNASVFKVKVIAVDTDGKVLDNDLLGYAKYAIYNEIIPPYTLKNDSMMVKGKEYKYQYWKYTYKDRKSEKEINRGNFTGKNVEFKAPDVYPNSTLEIKMVFKGPDKTNTFKVKVQAVDTDDKVLVDDLLGYEKFAKFMDVIPPYTIKDDKLKIKGKKYEYQNWKYTYLDAEGVEITKGVFTDKNVSFSAPDAYPDSTLTVKIIYKGPEPTQPSGTPTPTPPPGTPTPTPTPDVPPVIVPTSAPDITLDRDSPDPVGVINADKYVSPYFNSKKGISTTESQYVYVKTKDYLLGYKLVNRTGKVSYNVPVTVNYTLKYYTVTPKKKDRKQITVVTPIRHNYMVERAYSYWEITNLDYYTVNHADIHNYSLPDGGVTLTLDHSYVKCPSLSTNHSDTLTNHVIPPKEVTDGITLERTISVDSSHKPTIPQEDFSYYALTQTGEATVKNDYIMFDDKLVLSDTPSEKIAPEPNISGFTQSNKVIPDKALYTEGKVVDAKKTNGDYKSTGSVFYAMHPASVSAVVSRISFVVDVNNVTIHTPVICVPVVTADNDKWSQLINPTKDAVQVVLDPDNTLNDFTLSISNTLQHSNRLGYLTRDFSRSFIDPEYTSYLAREDGIVRNEVKLPFDVYQDTYNDKNKINDKYIKAGTWIVLGRNAYRFYVPMWVQEGVYTADFRSIAVNGDDKLDYTEYKKNSELRNYVATNTVNFEVSGRIYGLKLYDISDYPKWEEAFRKEKTMLFKYFEGAQDGTKYEVYNKDYSYYYAAGTKDQYGNDTGRYSKFTVPLVNGDHPQYKNLGVLKTGYAVRFLLDTVGEMYGGLSHIKIVPSFYYVDADGSNRRSVDLYYNETVKNDRHSLVKIGAGFDLVNLKTGPMDNIYNRIPEKEIANTAKVLNTSYAKVADAIAPMYAYSTFRLTNVFRTFIGTDYAASIAGLNSFKDVKASTGLTTTTLPKYMQRWYGTYKIPEDVHIVKAGYDVYGHLRKYGIDYKERFWLKGGYLIVNFNIMTIDARGKERLSYINADNYLNHGNCSMLMTEGAVLQKTDNKGVVFHPKAGDFIVYYSDKSYDDDYEGVLY